MTSTDIRAIVADHPAVLFMAGTPHSPRNPSGRRATQVLRIAKISFAAMDTAVDPTLPAALHGVSGSSTSTQFFAHGEFIGGCEVLLEMYRTGELQRLRDASDAG